MTDFEDQYAQHEELFSMLFGSSKWDSVRVASGLRSEHLTGGARLLAVILLADLIEGNGRWRPRQLKLVGDKKHFHVKDAKAEYDRIMEIGSWVQSEVEKGQTFRSALAGAEDEFGVSESTAQRAVEVFRKRIKLVEETGGWFPVLPVRKRKQSRSNRRDCKPRD